MTHDFALRRETVETPTRLTGRMPERFCTCCGRLVGADVLARRSWRKEAQLALFGLAGPSLTGCGIRAC